MRKSLAIGTKKGCLFHLTKNIYRKVQQSGLAQEYINNEQFRNNIRMIGALSFVPIADTVHAFTELSNHVGDQEQVILDYFETYYEGELDHGRRSNPRYPNMFWNVNARVQHHLLGQIIIWRSGIINLHKLLSNPIHTYGSLLKL